MFNIVYIFNFLILIILAFFCAETCMTEIVHKKVCSMGLEGGGGTLIMHCWS